MPRSNGFCRVAGFHRRTTDSESFARIASDLAMANPIPAVDPVTSAIFSVSFGSLLGSFLCLREKGPKSNEAMLPPRRDDDILVVQRPEDSTQPRGHAFNLLHGASSFSEIRRPKTFLPAQLGLTTAHQSTARRFCSSKKSSPTGIRKESRSGIKIPLRRNYLMAFISCLTMVSLK